jgi:hypothetical protein
MSINIEQISKSLSASIIAACETHLTTLVIRLSEELSKNNKCTQNEVINIWNDIAPDYSIILNKSIKKTIPGKICCFEYVRSKKMCDKEVSIESKTGNYCTRHLKSKLENPKKKAEENTEINHCEYEFIRGTNAGSICNGKVSEKSKTRKYCSKHLKQEEKKVDDEKTNEKEDTKLKLIPKLNTKLKLYIDKPTGFIFDRNNKKVYAKLVDNNPTALSDEDVELLDKNECEHDVTLFNENNE